MLLQQKLDGERKKGRETEAELKGQMEALRRDSQRVTDAVSSQLETLKAGAAALEAKKKLEAEAERLREELRAVKEALAAAAGGGDGAAAALVRELEGVRRELQQEQARGREAEARARREAEGLRAEAEAAAAAARRDGAAGAERQLRESVKGLQEALGAEQTRAREAEARCFPRQRNHFLHPVCPIFFLFSCITDTFFSAI